MSRNAKFFGGLLIGASLGVILGNITAHPQTITQTPQACKDVIQIDNDLFHRIGGDMVAYDFTSPVIVSQINATTSYIGAHTAERQAAVVACEGA